MLKEIKINELSPDQDRLYSAVGKGDITLVENLLAQGISLDGYDFSDTINSHVFGGNTPLIVAVMFGKVEAVKFLLSNGADSNLTHASIGVTPLHYAAFNLDEKTAELLLQYKANINAPDDRGKTVLHILLNPYKEATHLTLIKYFINNGADINIADKDGVTPLDLMKSQNIDVEIDNKLDNTIMADFSESSADDTTKMLGIDTHEE